MSEHMTGFNRECCEDPDIIRVNCVDGYRGIICQNCTLTTGLMQSPCKDVVEIWNQEVKERNFELES